MIPASLGPPRIEGVFFYSVFTFSPTAGQGSDGAVRPSAVLAAIFPSANGIAAAHPLRAVSVAVFPPRSRRFVFEETQYRLRSLT